ncbi:unnamed protein product [Zymoseptoria tritici ST99CH_3D7]|uniref:OPT family small oligopeptide transporter n=1 Tax=Zymoseptoria tritici (strain ST99CH_3D7) TaxID=1276538 RepID=A0A1X7RLW4_ZYMT9|nr:unnamed protein product [Zymoseptoria tritici ST99CH_3D7]
MASKETDVHAAVAEIDDTAEKGDHEGQRFARFEEKHKSTLEVHEVQETEENACNEPLNLQEEKAAAEVLADPRLVNYPVQLVARIVDLEDDFDEPVLTFRFWILTTFWGVIGNIVGTIFEFKPFAGSLPSTAVALFSWGMGATMAKYLPTRTFKFFKWKWTMNPGPFRIKEHVMIFMSYGVASEISYALEALCALQLWYGREPSPFWDIMYLMTSGFIGYGLAGLLREHLVSPPAFYYPLWLPYVAFFNGMHKDSAKAKQGIRAFWIAACVIFVWTWFPQLIIPVLSAMPLVCWMGHGNAKAYVLGSGNYGFGILSWTLDWNWIDPYVAQLPLWVTITSYSGLLFAGWFLYPILYYSNAFDSLSYGAMSTRVYLGNGSAYPTTDILTPQLRLNGTAFEEVGPPHWSTSYIFRFFFGFTAFAASLMFAALYYGQEAWRISKANWKGDLVEYNDPYLALMAKYPKVPRWWYYAILVLSIGLSMLTFYMGGFQLPWWGFVIFFIMCIIVTYPNGVLVAITGDSPGDAMLTDLLAGLLFHGNPMAVMSCMAYANPILSHCIGLLASFKLGIYMKIPETSMLIGQLYGQLLQPLVNYGIMRMIFKTVDMDILKGYKESVNWNALGTRAWYSASVLWGVIGPQRMFGPDSEYPFIYYGILIGFGLVLATWLIQRWKPHWNTVEWMNVPTFFNGMNGIPVSPMTGPFPSLILGLISMGYLYRYHAVWWTKYNYLLGLGLICGTAIQGVFQTFAISVPGLSFPEWWGNNVDYPDRCFPPNDDLPVAMQQ